MTALDATVARRDFATMVKAAHRGERVLLKKHGKRIAAVVPIRDLETLRAIEAQLDFAPADAAMHDVEEIGTIPWDDLKANMGL